MIGSTLTRYTPGHSFVMLDTETEGLNLGFTRPWQVAWGLANVKGQMGDIKVRYPWWADLTVSSDAARITRFDYAHYKANARPAAEVWAELWVDLSNPSHRVVWQNGLGMDIYVLRNWARACGVIMDESWLPRSIDTSALIKAQIKGWKPDVSSPEAFLAWQYRALEWRETGLKSNLTHVGKQRRIEHDYTTLHDAANDISLMAKIHGQIVFEVEY